MFQIIHFDTIDSTNHYAKIHIDQLHHFDVIHADYQTHGRGRYHHRWYSSPKQNLMVSIVLKEAYDPNTIYQLSVVTALSVVKFCQKYHLSTKIKFPNDIYLEDKKLAGILIETIFDPHLKGVIIGIGINVKESPINCQATSLHQAHCFLSIEETLSSFLNSFEKYYSIYKEGYYHQILDEVNAHSYLQDKEVIWQGQKARVNRLLADGLIEIDIHGKKKHILVNEFSLSE